MGSWQSLRPKPAQSPITMDIMVDILTIVDTGVDTVDTTDMVDTDTVDTGNVMLKLKLHPLPLLLPQLMPTPMHLPTTDTRTSLQIRRIRIRFRLWWILRI